MCKVLTGPKAAKCFNVSFCVFIPREKKNCKTKKQMKKKTLSNLHLHLIISTEFELSCSDQI